MINTHDRMLLVKHWNKISKSGSLDDDYLEKYKDSLNWHYISQYQILSEATIIKFKNKINWNRICKYQILSNNFMTAFKKNINFDIISKYQTLDETFMKNMQNNINWKYVCIYQNLSELFIIEFQNKVDWNLISQYQLLSENFITTYNNKVNWNLISQYQLLSENFITTYNNKVNWNLISQYQLLSENFIKTYNNKVNWSKIIQFQELSDSFITTYPSSSAPYVLNFFRISNTKQIVSFCKLIASTTYIRNDVISAIIGDTIMNKNHNWLYISEDIKVNRVKKFYEITTLSSSLTKFVTCYKAVKYDYTNIYGDDPFLYNSLTKEYKTECNFMDNIDNAQGFSCWTYKNVKKFALSMGVLDYRIITVKIPLKSMCMLSNGKIRASQMTIVTL